MLKRLLLSVITSVLVAGSVSAQAAVSEWVTIHGGAIRLISAGPPVDGTYKAGLEFFLEPGWHTYWRFPGEAGIPPDIRISAPQALSESKVLYPVPSRYTDGFSASIVYHDAVVLPLAITPEDKGGAVDLTVTAFFGICKDICVPGDASLSLRLAPDSEADKTAERLIDRDLALVPVPASDAGPKILGIEDEWNGQNHRLVIRTEVSKTGDVDLFAEGPEGSYIALPVLQSRSGTQAIWTLSTRGLAQVDKGGSVLTLVLKDGGQAIESRQKIPPRLLPASKAK